MANPAAVSLTLTETDELKLSGRSLDNGQLVTRLFARADGNYHDCICPHCRRDLSIKVSIVHESDSFRPRRAPPAISKHNFGYVALIYGAAPAYFVGALVTGWSLSKHTKLPLECRVLLCTDDVPEAFISLLSAVWTIQKVEYINKASPWFYWDYHKSRFKQVFTKLRILEDLNGSFRKVVLLDVDLLIRGEIDSLFDLPAPASMVRGQNNLKHGEGVPMDTFYVAHRQTIGINCGVMLVEPSKLLFDQMLQEVESHYHPEHWPSHGPEQDYLSRFYNAFGQWTNISCRYNYQVHLNQYGSLEWHHLNVKGHPDVSVFHFSGQLVKPWSLLLDLRIAHDMQYSQIAEFIIQIHLNAEKELLLQQKVVSEDDNHHEKTTSIESHFCFGIGASARKTKRCYLDRHIHPSWTRADSDSAIEWIHTFKEADEFLNGRVVSLLQSLWQREKIGRSDLS